MPSTGHIALTSSLTLWLRCCMATAELCSTQHQKEPSSICHELGVDLGNRVTSVYVSRTWSSRRRAISRSALLSCLQKGTSHMVEPCTACSEEQRA